MKTVSKGGRDATNFSKSKKARQYVEGKKMQAKRQRNGKGCCVCVPASNFCSICKTTGGGVTVKTAQAKANLVRVLLDSANSIGKDEDNGYSRAFIDVDKSRVAHAFDEFDNALKQEDKNGK